MSAAPRIDRPSYVRTRSGADLFCRDWGQGPVLVFLASWALPSDAWTYVMLPLSEQGFRCVAYDRRGHGRSSDPGGGYDFDTLADDLADVLEALDLREATLVGHSMAAGEVVRYASRRSGGRAARLALVSTTTPCLARRPDNPEGVDPAVFETVRRDGFLRDFPRWTAEMRDTFAVPGQASDQMLEWARSLTLQPSLQALVHLNRALTAEDFRPELPAIAEPTLVVHGGRDETSPLALTGEPTARLLRNARLTVYPDAPHGLPLTHAARLVEDLAGFARAEACAA